MTTDYLDNEKCRLCRGGINFTQDLFVTNGLGENAHLSCYETEGRSKHQSVTPPDTTLQKTDFDAL